MKNLLLLLTLFSFSVQAQITINTNDLPVANSVYWSSTTTLPGAFSPTATGPNYTWDYSQLISNGQVSDTFIDEASTASLLSLFYIDSPLNPNRSNQAVRGADFSLAQI